MMTQNFVRLPREEVEQLVNQLSSRCGTNADEWLLINKVRAALTEQVQPAHPPRVTQADVNVCKSITEQLEELTQRTKEIDARYGLQSNAERVSFPDFSPIFSGIKKGQQ